MFDLSRNSVEHQINMLPLCSKYCGEEVCHCQTSRVFFRALMNQRDKLEQEILNLKNLVTLVSNTCGRGSCNCVGSNKVKNAVDNLNSDVVI